MECQQYVVQWLKLSELCNRASVFLNYIKTIILGLPLWNLILRHSVGYTEDNLMHRPSVDEYIAVRTLSVFIIPCCCYFVSENNGGIDVDTSHSAATTAITADNILLNVGYYCFQPCIAPAYKQSVAYARFCLFLHVFARSLYIPRPEFELWW